ncbi:MAG: SDR family oxidoreductase [Propionibacteriaceae bacterium]|jgi:NAD(P)-dependent dehydrogenase (short-subunit alcohol dehydrogenase family)|nr:SDR family oxidoreductase [Propionibacteriaceae bacterium]
MSKTVVVTGSGSGIGKAIAEVLAQRGWQVIATDIDLEAAKKTAAGLDTAAGQAHEAAHMDITDAAEVAALADDVADRLGLDGWVSNAGISFMEDFLKMPIEKMDRSIDVNLKGCFISGQAAARAMVRTSKPGRIVNTASMAGKAGRVSFLADYVAGKFGVVGLTQAMACELGKYGITVNSVCPGYVRTSMQERELVWEANLRGKTVPEVQQMMIDDTPLGRIEEAHDVAKVVAFLMSDDADFITGEAIAVNGGAYMD